MIVSLPCAAFAVPPDTGASRNSTPRSASFASVARANAGGTVAVRTTSAPGARCSRAPPGP